MEAATQVPEQMVVEPPEQHEQLETPSQLASNTEERVPEHQGDSDNLVLH